MVKGPKLQAVEISEAQAEVLEQFERRHQTPQQMAKRVRVVLLAVQGLGNRDISRIIGLDRMQVGTWRKRWITEYDRLCRIETEHPKQLEDAIKNLFSDVPRSGAPATFTAEQVVQIIALACENPEDSQRPISHWTTRELADEAMKRGIVRTISERQVGRFLKSGGSEAPSESLLAKRHSE
ncbi:helix-turn-helix domain-containing protein [Cohnella fermenti]|uniref:Helix-turn-helix domain-containing protein n=1 Tax=Cohnella fermenti TaxID=2565925 RepID=A0A4S4BHK3_9BACL|nr:helix-turn-helix domain-containing protein [Cohnella fermenti]THF73417.1 helix-turn-helix domain-containing protein [Cohnella fermenti]